MCNEDKVQFLSKTMALVSDVKIILRAIVNDYHRLDGTSHQIPGNAVIALVDMQTKALQNIENEYNNLHGTIFNEGK